MSDSLASVRPVRLQPAAQGLYDPAHEHDACGVGFIAHLSGNASHEILEGALIALKNLAHRGAIDADAVTGDGAGVLTQLPYELLLEFLKKTKARVPAREDLAVAMLFLPLLDAAGQRRGQEILAAAVRAEGLEFLAWREVPCDNGCLGRKAEATRPHIVQGLIARPQGMSDAAYDRALLLAQRTATRQAAEAGIADFYICSMSPRTVTYKGLFNAPQVRKFFTDLRDPRYVTAFAIFHQRFATNTFPDWKKAQPFRQLAHNGEINTIRGNRNNLKARERAPLPGVWGERYADLRPLVEPDMSDSASFDNCLQLMSVGGRSVVESVATMMPAAWHEDALMPEPVRAFHRYHSAMLEPWDGPAAIVFTDGRMVGASLDRNGLRPARFKVYDDGTVILASEVGLVPRDEHRVVRAGRLGPGRMLAIDFQRGILLEDEALKAELAAAAPYGPWCRENITALADLPAAPVVPAVAPEATLVPHRIVFGCDLDEESAVLRPTMESGKEPITSMGDDTPLAPLSRRPRLLATYFKQLFAQVTNPAIDSLRERTVMSSHMLLGGRLGLFDEGLRPHALIDLETPVLLSSEYAAVLASPHFAGCHRVLESTFVAAQGPEALEPALEALRAAARVAAEGGARLLVLSDRSADATRAPLPILLALGAVHTELVRSGHRLQVDLIADSGEIRDVHQLACALGLGANAVHPWLALELMRRLAAEPPKEGAKALDLAKGWENYRKAMEAGLLKIMAKMGISTLRSYQGARLFEALGIHPRVIDACFPGVASPIGGIDYSGIAAETLRRHAEAYPVGLAPELWHEGYVAVNKKGGEYHGWSPKVVSGMNTFIRKGGDYAAFATYKEASEVHQPVTPKDLLRLRFPAQGVALAEVESVEDIRRRFTTAGMSLGALSPEMHETLAIAMNRIGGKSNSGEGGEDPVRFKPLENGDNANSAIKQVASGRFGVTAEYLANAKEIEIKISQGAKPGEGGQLMGWKVSPLIARLRFSVPGVSLISPPPHHDIYSIEDLAQLIFDLKEVNPRAQVCVKLVALSGVGTVAAGVAKAYADVILISGHEGGTGASPISSIKHAGSAWEIGLAEAHQVLMLNDLRNRVTLRTDGGMKTGRDIVIAALLGAEEYNFGTAALIAGGCAMFRVCHLNTCPVGVTTQREDLRAKFRGKPEYIINYFNAVAEDVRILLAKLGARTMDEIVGRTDLLEQIDDPRNPKSRALDFGRLLHNPDPSGEQSRIHTRARNDRFGNEGSLDDAILQDAKQTITLKRPAFHYAGKVANTNRNIGTRLSGEIAYLHGNEGLQPGTLSLDLQGSCGQGFGTFLVQGLRLRLVGEANDYVGKGMCGGEIIVRPRPGAAFAWHENTIMGNTCLFGATGGVLFGAGQAGERFAVRNSGATAVIEGVGDHACEYMTRGTVVILGRTGRNLGAGMSGGVVFVYDPEHRLPARHNPEMVTLEALQDGAEIQALRRLIELHVRLTGSARGAEILDSWERSVAAFVRVTPITAPEIDKPVFTFDKRLSDITV